MFKRKNRLTTKEINEFGRGKNVHSEHFSIVYKRSNEENGSKFAVIVSKKVAKKAMDRNKIKRRIREVLKEWLKQNQKPVFLMVHTKKGVGELNFSELKVEVSDILCTVIE